MAKRPSSPRSVDTLQTDHEPVPACRQRAGTPILDLRHYSVATGRIVSARRSKMLSDIRIRPLLFGLASRVPGVTTLFRRGAGGIPSPRYCYSVWLRHLVAAHQAGITSLPKSVGELGPGDSLGTGFAALLSGAERYYAF